MSGSRVTPLWAGYSTRENISCSQHADALKSFLEAAEIVIGKVTHVSAASHCFFAERLCQEVPHELVSALLPVDELQAKIDKMTKQVLAGSPSALALCSENQELREAAAANKVIQLTWTTG